MGGVANFNSRRLLLVLDGPVDRISHDFQDRAMPSHSMSP